jgi:hypothetical protein
MIKPLFTKWFKNEPRREVSAMGRKLLESPFKGGGLGLCAARKGLPGCFKCHFRLNDCVRDEVSGSCIALEWNNAKPYINMGLTRHITCTR